MKSGRRNKTRRVNLSEEGHNRPWEGTSMFRSELILSLEQYTLHSKIQRQPHNILLFVFVSTSVMRFSL